MILKHYLIRTWLKSFFIILGFFTLVITVSTFVNGFLRDSVTNLEVLIDYILNLPRWITMILPFSCLTATLFGLESLKGTNELTAMLAGGFSRKSIIKTLLSLATCIALVQYILVGHLRPIFTLIHKNWLESSGANFKDATASSFSSSFVKGGKIWYKSGDYFLAFEAFDYKKKELYGFEIFYITPEFRLEKFISAKKALYLGDNKWRLESAAGPEQLSQKDFPKKIVFESQNPVITINESVENFKSIQAEVATLMPVELYSYIRRLKTSGINTNEYEILFYDKFAFVIICLIFTLIPLQSLFRPNRRQSTLGQNILFTLVFSVGYFLLFSACSTLGENGKLPPFIAVFLVPFALALFTCQQINRHKTLQ